MNRTHTNFIFCIHNHQPVGNFDFVVEDAYKMAYLPFLNTLSDYPSIKLSLHLSGHLLDYLLENHREYIELLSAMIERGQVEMLGGGYYEPVLASIPTSDRIGQIKMMSDKLYELFGKRPQGIWLTERVWEPHLPESLQEAGIEYVVVDDYHFVKAGLKRDDLSGYYITEEQGHILKVFPGSERLRYIMPFEPAHRFIDYMKGIKAGLPFALSHAPLAVFADDGEKFGAWPETHKWVYQENWLKNFLEMITSNLEWIKPVTFSEYIAGNAPSGRVYLPTTSYMEMGEWALPGEASIEYTNLVNDVKTWQDGERIKRFLQGGMWRNFMAKYSEANWMHKRMLMVSEEVRRQRSSGQGVKESRFLLEPPNPKTLEPLFLLYKAQCNDAYWHGVFGGLYLPHLRSAIYENLIKAENLLEAGVKGSRSQGVKVEDFDADTYNEILIRTEEFNIFLKPHSGGSIQELDFRPVPYNLTNCLTRCYEGYHNRIKRAGHGEGSRDAKSIHDMTTSKEEGLEKALIYDNYDRCSLVEHFASPDTPVAAFLSGNYMDSGNFVDAQYKHEISSSPLKVMLGHNGMVSGKPVLLQKKISAAQKPFIKIVYQITNQDANPLHTIFLSEWNILIGFGMKPQDLGMMEEFELQEDWLGLKFRMQFEPIANLYIYPVETVSLSEAGFEKNFQGLCILPSWELKLNAQETCKIELLIDVSSISIPKALN